MTIDFHTHVFPDGLASKVIPPMGRRSRVAHYADGTAAGLRASMARAGVDLSVVLPVATNPGQVVKLNDLAAAQNARWRETGLLSFGCIHPDFSDCRGELKRIKGLGLPGVKLHPPYQQVPLDDPRYLRILEECARLDLIAVTHAGIDVGVPGEWCTPDMCLRAVRSVGWSKLVLAHLGGWRQWDEVLDKLAGEDVYLDTAFAFGALEPAPGTERGEDERWLITPEQFTAIVSAHGAHRVLFATDSPWQDQSRSLAALDAMPLSERDRLAIRGENARALLGL